MAKWPRPASARKPDTIRLGGVPIKVVMPPRIVPKASGISTWPGVISSRPDSCAATGINSAIAPTLFMKPDKSAPSPIKAAMLVSRPASRGRTVRANQSTAPVFCSPWLSTSTQATVITAGWPKPAKASAAGTRPATTQAISASKATISCRNRPQRNSAIVAVKIAKIRSCSVVIGGGSRKRSVGLHI